jgi:hypothetical protein
MFKKHIKTFLSLSNSQMTFSTLKIKKKGHYIPIQDLIICDERVKTLKYCSNPIVCIFIHGGILNSKSFFVFFLLKIRYDVLAVQKKKKSFTLHAR